MDRNAMIYYVWNFVETSKYSIVYLLSCFSAEWIKASDLEYVFIENQIASHMK